MPFGVFLPESALNAPIIEDPFALSLGPGKSPIFENLNLSADQDLFLDLFFDHADQGYVFQGIRPAAVSTLIVM